MQKIKSALKVFGICLLISASIGLSDAVAQDNEEKRGFFSRIFNRGDNNDKPAAPVYTDPLTNREAATNNYRPAPSRTFRPRSNRRTSDMTFDQIMQMNRQQNQANSARAAAMRVAMAEREMEAFERNLQRRYNEAMPTGRVSDEGQDASSTNDRRVRQRDGMTVIRSREKTSPIYIPRR